MKSGPTGMRRREQHWAGRVVLYAMLSLPLLAFGRLVIEENVGPDCVPHGGHCDHIGD